jgi:hypothetical protein
MQNFLQSYTTEYYDEIFIYKQVTIKKLFMISIISLFCLIFISINSW